MTGSEREGEGTDVGVPVSGNSERGACGCAAGGSILDGLSNMSLRVRKGGRTRTCGVRLGRLGLKWRS